MWKLRSPAFWKNIIVKIKFPVVWRWIWRRKTATWLTTLLFSKRKFEIMPPVGCPDWKRISTYFPNLRTWISNTSSVAFLDEFSEFLRTASPYFRWKLEFSVIHLHRFGRKYYTYNIPPQFFGLEITKKSSKMASLGFPLIVRRTTHL